MAKRINPGGIRFLIKKYGAGAFSPAGHSTLVVMEAWPSETNAGEDQAMVINSVQDAFRQRPAWIEVEVPDLDGNPVLRRIPVNGPVDADYLVRTDELLREHTFQVQVCEELQSRDPAQPSDEDWSTLEQMERQLVDALAKKETI